MRRCWIVLAALAGSLTAAAADAQVGRMAGSPIRTASLERDVTEGAPQRVRFTRRPPVVGDRVEQEISLELRLTTSIRQGATLSESNSTTMRNRQRRTLTTTGIDADRMSAVSVRYWEATKQIDRGEAEAPVAPAAGGAEPVTKLPAEPAAEQQPVAGKTYHCHRDAGEASPLIITDEQGHIPPMDQYEIVAQQMEMVGRSNPLVEYFADREVAVGQTVSLPQELATRLFGLGGEFGEVTRFDLTLQSIALEKGVRCALFHAEVEAASSDSSQMRLQVAGPLVMQADTCRAVRIELTGPLGMSQSRGSLTNAYQVIGTGKLAIRLSSTYRDAAH